MSLGCAIIVLSAAAIVAILRRWGRADLGGDLDLSTEAFRVRLVRSKLDQARLLRAAPLWYVIPLYTGVVLFFLGIPVEGERPWSYLIVATVFFAAVAALNLWAARRLRQEATSLQTSTPTMVVAVFLAGLTGCATPRCTEPVHPARPCEDDERADTGGERSLARCGQRVRHLQRRGLKRRRCPCCTPAFAGGTVLCVDAGQCP